MATYVNDLRLKEIATGDEAGTWGTSTNTNLELIGEALGYGTQDCFSSDADATTTVADGASDPARAMYFKVTSSATLSATRTLTIAPNTISRVMFIENGTTGSQSITISQGSGANVTIATGKTAVVYLDGAGSGAAVVDAMALVDPGVTDTLAEVLTAGNTTGGTSLVVSSGDDVTFTGASANVVFDSSDSALEFGDNAKAVFGAGSDLEIFHESSTGRSFIKETGSDEFRILGSDIRIKNGGDSKTYMQMTDGGSVAIRHNDSTKLETTSTGVDVTGSVTANGGVVVDNITIDGTEIDLSSGDLTLDVAGDIILDADGGDFIFVDGGTNRARVKINDSSNVDFEALTADHTMRFRGVDSSSTITALTLNMAEAGEATFNDDVNLGDSKRLRMGAGGDFEIFHDGSNNYIKGATSDQDLIFQGVDGGSAITALTLDMSEAGAAAFNAGATFNGSVGIGTSSPDSTLHVHAASAGSVTALSGTNLTVEGNANNYLSLLSPDANLSALVYGSPSSTNNASINSSYNSGSPYLNFNTGGSEAMRIDSSGNVGIGVSDPGDYDSRAERLVVGESGDAGITIACGSSSDARLVFAVTDQTDLSNGSIGYDQSNDTMAFETAGSERLRIDSSGRVGVGVTPESWAATFTPVQVGAAASFVGSIDTSNARVVANAYWDTTDNRYEYINSDFASAYNQVDSEHQWLIAASGTADAAISFTQAMTLDASGNLGIGTTSPAELVVLDKSSGRTFIRFDKSGTFKGLVGITDTAGDGSSASAVGDIILRSETRVLLDTGGTTRAVVDASGNAGIGTTSPSSRLTVSGSFDATSAGSKPSITGAGNYGGGIGFIDTNVSGMYTDTSGANLKFFTNQSSSDTAASKVAMTIDGSSNLLVGRTSTLNAGQASILGAASKQALTLQVTSDGNSLIQGFDSSGNLEFQVTGGGAVSTGGQLSIATTGAGNSLGCFLNQGTGANFYEASDGTKTMIAGTDGSQTFVKLGSLSNHSVGLVTNNTERVSIDTSGKVGIGISSPSTDALHVVASGLDDDDDTIVLGANFSSATTLGSIGTHHEDVNNGGLKFSSKTSGTLTEYMRLDASGNVLVGKSGAGSSNVGVELRQAGYIFGTGDGINPLRLNRKTSDGMIADFQKDGTSVGSIGSISSDLYIAEGNSGLRFDGENNQILPASTTASTDGTCNLGAGSARFDDIFATNGTIQTSDRNEKQDIEALSDAEQRVAVAAKGLLRKFRWKTAVTEKGNDARIHFGIIAQDLQAAFEAEGLDAGRYAMFINSTWTDEETGEERSRMGVRYSELLAFIIAAI